MLRMLSHNPFENRMALPSGITTMIVHHSCPDVEVLHCRMWLLILICVHVDWIDFDFHDSRAFHAVLA